MDQQPEVTPTIEKMTPYTTRMNISSQYGVTRRPSDHRVQHDYTPVCNQKTHIFGLGAQDSLINSYLYLFIASFATMSLVYSLLFIKLFRYRCRCCPSRQGALHGSDAHLTAQDPRNRRSHVFQRNMRLAIMLFAVALAFVITYGPAIAMSLQWVPYQMTVYNMYFLNHVLNPVIYAFISREFRGKLKSILWKSEKPCNGKKTTDVICL